MSFQSSNYTQVPNELFDMMADMTDSELRITLVAIRQIMGYHKTKPEPISLSQYQQKTGLSRQGVMNGIDAAIKRGNIKKSGKGKRNVTKYSLVIEDTNHEISAVDQSTELTSEDVTSQPSRPVTSQPSRHTKEKKKEINTIVEPPVELVVLDKELQHQEPQAVDKSKKVNPAALLGEAFGIMPVTKQDWGLYGKVCKTLQEAGIAASEFGHYIKWVQKQSKSTGGWKVTITSLTSNGRPSEYISKRDSQVQTQRKAEPLPAITQGEKDMYRILFGKDLEDTA